MEDTKTLEPLKEYVGTCKVSQESEDKSHRQALLKIQLECNEILVHIDYAKNCSRDYNEAT